MVAEEMDNTTLYGDITPKNNITATLSALQATPAVKDHHQTPHFNENLSKNFGSHQELLLIGTDAINSSTPVKMGKIMLNSVTSLADHHRNIRHHGPFSSYHKMKGNQHLIIPAPQLQKTRNTAKPPTMSLQCQGSKA